MNNRKPGDLYRLVASGSQCMSPLDRGTLTANENDFFIFIKNADDKNKTNDHVFFHLESGSFCLFCNTYIDAYLKNENNQ